METAPTLPADLIARLGRHRVFGQLSEAVRAGLAPQFLRVAFEPGEPIAAAGSLNTRLGWVLQGQVVLQAAGQRVPAATLHRGDLFGAGAMTEEALEGWSAAAQGRSVVAFLGADTVAALRDAHPVLALLLVRPVGGIAMPATPRADPHIGLITRPVRSLIKREPVTLPPDATILTAARTMRDQRVSSVMLVEQGLLVGIVTDRDLRNRALASGHDAQAPVHEIATVAPLTVDVHQPAFEALLLMARHHIHHVPVLDGSRVVGMITATDVSEHHSTSAVHVAGEIHKQTSVEGLVAAASRVKQLQASLAAANASAYSTGRIVTAITDAITTRLLQLTEAELGPAPVDYAWVAAGSQARSEQTAKSDQDNCMVLDDRYDPAAHGDYFKALANRVNDGLHACGYVHCPGDMMARTDEWRQPQSRWAQYFRRWTDQPDPKALMLTCVFFDMRLIHGRASLLDQLRAEVLARTRDQRIFLAHMVSNALTHRPPLTLFGGISTVRADGVRDAVDLKHSGIVPIVDLARVYALAVGHPAVNTHERLEIAAQSREITEQGARDLRDALEFLASLRIRHQARQTLQGVAADNMLSLSELSNFERTQLKNAFNVVQVLQTVLSHRYR